MFRDLIERLCRQLSPRRAGLSRLRLQRCASEPDISLHLRQARGRHRQVRRQAGPHEIRRSTCRTSVARLVSASQANVRSKSRSWSCRTRTPTTRAYPTASGRLPAHCGTIRHQATSQKIRDAAISDEALAVELHARRERSRPGSARTAGSCSGHSSTARATRRSCSICSTTTAPIRALYPQWQEYFRQHQPPTLIVWGKNDVIFPASGAHPYKRDLKTVDFNLLEHGHFALEDHARSHRRTTSGASPRR